MTEDAWKHAFLVFANNVARTDYISPPALDGTPDQRQTSWFLRVADAIFQGSVLPLMPVWANLV